MHETDRDLGMMCAFSRRDFLNGVGVALTGVALAPPLGLSAGTQSVEQAPDYYPPLRTGLRGQPPGLLRSGPPAARSALVGSGS